MPENLYAACGSRDSLVVKRVALDAHLQREVSDLFADQKRAFHDGIDAEIPFDGSWKPDENELLTIDAASVGAAIFENALSENASSFPQLDVGNFEAEGIQALFTGDVDSLGNAIALIQNFSTAQILSKKRLSFVHDGNTFRRLSEPSFCIGASLTAVSVGGVLKFKSFHQVRQIVDLVSTYKAATDAEIDKFSQHSSVEVVDLTSLKSRATATERRLLHAVYQSGILDRFTVRQIQSKAKAVGLDLNTKGGKLLLPAHTQEAISLLRFLHDDLYEAPLTGQRYMTNSKQPA